MKNYIIGIRNGRLEVRDDGQVLKSTPASEEGAKALGLWLSEDGQVGGWSYSSTFDHPTENDGIDVDYKGLIESSCRERDRREMLDGMSEPALRSFVRHVRNIVYGGYDSDMNLVRDPDTSNLVDGVMTEDGLDEEEVVQSLHSILSYYGLDPKWARPNPKEQ